MKWTENIFAKITLEILYFDVVNDKCHFLVL